jgi:hypothetical protein
MRIEADGVTHDSTLADVTVRRQVLYIIELTELPNVRCFRGPHVPFVPYFPMYLVIGNSYSDRMGVRKMKKLRGNRRRGRVVLGRKLR